jgi:hypothetical protein
MSGGYASRRRFLAALAAASTAGLSGCQSGDETDDGTGTDDGDETDAGTGEGQVMGNLRVGHLSPDAPNVDVYVDGNAVLEDVPFGAFSDYLELEVGDHDIQITAAGDPETVVYDETVEIGEGSFTAVALGELSEENQPFSVEILEDDLGDPGEQARVRALHASPDAPNVDITIASTGDVLFGDVPFGGSATNTVEPGQYTLEFRPATAENDGEVVATFDVDIAAGMVYTAAAAGYLQPDAAPGDEPFDLIVTVDNEMGM